MTDYKKYINALRKCAKEHEDDRTSFGHIIVSDLCRDTANLLESLEQESTAKENLVVEDCISRNTVLTLINDVKNANGFSEYSQYEYLFDQVDAMPSVIPQEPTTKENLVVEDCISRQAVDRLAMRYLREPTDKHVAFYEEFIELPPVTPKPKTGHWIVYEDCEGKTRRCVCDRCGHETGDYTWKNPNFCEECGAKMLPTDSEKE